eukprot:364217-Chlamydomonas_euryale.AAC.4
MRLTECGDGIWRVRAQAVATAPPRVFGSRRAVMVAEKSEGAGAVGRQLRRAAELRRCRGGDAARLFGRARA